MDPLRFAIAAVPLAAYLLLVGLVNMRRRPMLVTGANDLAALGAAASGLAFVGPIELFRPAAATEALGDAIWVTLLVLYWLWVSLGVMLARPRLVVYNATSDELRPAVAEAVAQLDPTARWAGDSLVMPNLGIRLHLDGFDLMSNTSLVSSGGKQSLEGWAKLGKAMRRSLRSIETTPNPRSGGFLLAAALLMFLSVWGLAGDPQQVAVALDQLFGF
ncbi:hypothetical protein Mal64_25390 [Pseudobythopirellula maris]|uniref:Uncharacterized protein n=1 Tax=Pseudobythopirellula maris TaxID=2527991 RepID=A0A5C5ZQ44_9BACT|nr:hypothetical protein [Pseudobythopirellula maris]TWT89047.1 hypothetical protein Mal64_25390 [Pseudobythopirellula maris]